MGFPGASATARATSMSCEALWRALLAGRPALKGSARRVVLPAADGQPEHTEERAMGKADWLQLLAHILTAGHAATGLFGRVESSASDSDGAAAAATPGAVAP